MKKFDSIKYFQLMKGLLFISFCLCLFISCSNTTETGYSQAGAGFLNTKWINSYEESASDGEIYRPDGYKDFPAGRYRRTYTFEADGKCKYLVLSPVDAHYEVIGKWSFDQDQNLILIRGESDKEILSLRIVELKKNLLKIQTMIMD